MFSLATVLVLKGGASLKPKLACGHCKSEVQKKFKHVAVCCDNCNGKFCIKLHSKVYTVVLESRQSCTWICDCGSANFVSSTCHTRDTDDLFLSIDAFDKLDACSKLDTAIPHEGSKGKPKTKNKEKQKKVYVGTKRNSTGYQGGKNSGEAVALAENHPAKLLRAASSETPHRGQHANTTFSTLMLSSDDTSDVEEVPKAPLEGASALGEHEAKDQSHREVQQYQVDDTCNNQPVYGKGRHPCHFHVNMWDVGYHHHRSAAAQATARSLHFTRPQILQMTDSSSNSRKIADGTFGPVYYIEKFPYEGPLKGRSVAVKVNRSADQGRRESVQELAMEGSRHPHLLPLQGTCDDKGCQALIYPYMSNKDLLSCIKDKKHPLNYKQRLLISLDLISAVNYNHTQHDSCRKKKIYRDVKSSKVLLDENCRVRLDPGLPQTGNSSTLCGTPNYRDPYYTETSKIHETSEQYSAGRVLLELLTGKPADAVDKEGISLFTNWRDELGYFNDSTGKRLCEVADYSIGKWPKLTKDGNSVTQQFARLIIGCLQSHRRKRIKPGELHQKLKDLVKAAGALGTFSTVMPSLCIYCLTSKPCPIPMACGCNLVCASCMKEHTKDLYCPTHHTNTTGLGQNTFAVIVGQRGFEEDAKAFRDAITDPNICGIRTENVEVLFNAKSQEVQKKVEQLGAKIKMVPPGQQTTFIYYHSGHGRKVWTSKPQPGPVSGLAYKDNVPTWSCRLRSILKKSGAHNSLFILDACFSASIRLYYTKGCTRSISDGSEDSHEAEDGYEESQDDSRMETQMQYTYDDIVLVPEGSLLWASCRSNEVSVRSDDRSVFTKYIVKGLRGHKCSEDRCADCWSFQCEAQNTGGVSLNLLHDYVWQHVTRELPMRPSLVGQQEKRYWMAYTQEQ